MQAWKAITDALVEEGAKFVFGLTANPWEFWDYLADTKIKPILVRHELSSVFMAMAHARLTGRPGICFNSPGPGVANMFTGFLEASTGCMPVIAPSPCGPISTEGMGQFQETDFLPAFRTVSKWAYRVTSPDRIPWAMRRAFSISTSGKPGPVFLEIPMDVGNMHAKPPEYRKISHAMKTRADQKDVRSAIDLISKSERPVIIAGGGVIIARAFMELVDLAETLGIPVLTTPSGRGSIPEDHPLSVGLVGLYRTKVGKRVYEESDLIISVASKNEEFQTCAWMYIPDKAKIIQIDVDPFEIGRNIVPDVALVGDAKLVLEDLLSNLSELMRKGNKMRSERLTNIAKAKTEFEASIESECIAAGSSPIMTKRVVHELNKVFGKGTILANENGSQDLWSYYSPYFKVLDYEGCMGMPEQTCFGLGVVGSIGAKITRPDSKVVCTTGDAAFQFAMKEIPTAVQYNAPVTWLVFNNFGLGWEKYYQKYWIPSGRFTNTNFDIQPDFVKIAEANKCYGERVEKPEDISSALKRGLQANMIDGLPAVLEFIVSTFDFPEGFHEFHEREWGKPVKPII